MGKGSERSLFFDILKGLGILMIVFGHTGFPGGGFVYLFHLELFFLVTGYLYNEKKYGDDPFLYFARRLGGSWTRYMLYCLLLTVLHNYCMRHGLLSGVQVQYQAVDVLVSVLHSVFFQSPELLAGPMWFMSLWLVASALFSSVIYLGRKSAVSFPISHSGTEGESRIKKWFVLLLFTGISIAVGQYLVGRRMSLMYHIELAFVVLPFFVIGYGLHSFANGFWKKMPIVFMVLGIPVVSAGLHQCNRLGIFFDLASLNIHGMVFYPVVLLGFFWSFLVAGLLERIPVLNHFMAWIGRYSFDVMALHMLVFKGVDLLLRKFYYRDPSLDISIYPSAFAPKFGIPYTILGVLLPVCFASGVEFVWRKIKMLPRTNRAA